MISFFFDAIGSLFHALLSVVSFAGHSLFSLFSNVVSMVLWPVKSLFSSLQDWWELPPQWAALSLVGIVVVLVVLAFLALLGYSALRKKWGR